MTIFAITANFVACKSVYEGLKGAKKSIGYLLYQFVTPAILLVALATMYFTEFGSLVFSEHYFKFFYILTCYWSRN